MKTSVDFLCSMFVKQVNKQPDEGITGDKNHGKDQDGHELPLEPAVDKINENIGHIEHTPVDESPLNTVLLWKNTAKNCLMRSLPPTTI